jgi:hypothetical protein
LDCTVVGKFDAKSAFDFVGSVFEVVAGEAFAQEDKVSLAFVEVEEDEHLAVAFSLLEDLAFLAEVYSLAEAEVIHFLTKALH